MPVIRTTFGLLALSLSLALAATVRGLAAEAPLPLESVVLFTSGVGYFQHAGEVTGDATVEMQFAADDVNDLLKSMVVLDRDGGAATVTYASRDPVTKTLGGIGSCWFMRIWNSSNT